MQSENRTIQLQQKQVSISCIVPVLNEEEVIARFLTALHQQLQALSKQFEIIIIDDGSHDNTVNVIENLISQIPCKLIVLSRNFGKDKAITAGLEHCLGDVAVIIDADFQHPFKLLPTFLEKWAAGYDIAYGVRKNRKDESWLKRRFTKLFYTLMKVATDANIPPNVVDFQLLDRRVIEALLQCEERDRFMKGLFSWVGFKSVAIPFEVSKRPAGKSSWPLRRLAGLAVTGITSFSDIPLRIWGLIGLFISTLALSYALYIVLNTLIFGVDLPGFATITVAIMFFGGIQLLSIGILGEYIARIFREVKHRPQYIIAKTYGFNFNNQGTSNFVKQYSTKTAHYQAVDEI